MLLKVLIQCWSETSTEIESKGLEILWYLKELHILEFTKKYVSLYFIILKNSIFLAIHFYCILQNYLSIDGVNRPFIMGRKKLS